MVYITFENENTYEKDGISPHFNLTETFKNMTILQKVNPYINYPFLKKKNSRNRSIFQFKQTEYERKNREKFRKYRTLFKEFHQNKLLNGTLFKTQTESTIQKPNNEIRQIPNQSQVSNSSFNID